MIRENDKEREEKILRAIGDLPEDMVAQAAEYRRPKHRLAGFSVWKGLAMAACAAIVIIHRKILAGIRTIQRTVCCSRAAGKMVMCQIAVQQRGQVKSSYGQLRLWSLAN